MNNHFLRSLPSLERADIYKLRKRIPCFVLLAIRRTTDSLSIYAFCTDSVNMILMLPNASSEKAKRVTLVSHYSTESSHPTQKAADFIHFFKRKYFIRNLYVECRNIYCIFLTYMMISFI